MMLGDRGRLPSFRRTTSVTLLSVDVSDMEATPQLTTPGFRTPRFDSKASGGSSLVETAHFLKTCGFCNRNLAPSRDIYMYRGDTAFCSVECREHQMKQDEVKERCAANSIGGGYRPEVSAVVAEASDSTRTAMAA